MTTYATGAALVLEDRFSAGFRELFRSVEEASVVIKALNKEIGGIGFGFGEAEKAAIKATSGIVGELTGLGDDVRKQALGIGTALSDVFSTFSKSADFAANSVVASLARVDAASKITVDDLARMEALGASSAMSAIRQPGSGGFGPAGHGGSSGVHFGRLGGEVGGVHASIAGNAGLAFGALALDGIYQAAEIDDVVAKALATSQIKVGPGVSRTDAGKRIHDMIQSASKLTGFGFHDTGESILEGQRLLNQMPFDKRNELLEKILPFAGQEAKMKGSTMSEAVEAIIGIAHQTQTYDPAGIERIAKGLAYTSILTPSPLPQFKTALGYSLPELYNGLGMDPSVIMTLTASMQQSGIAGTKSGTWLRSFFENSEPGNDEHNEALRKLGMLDASNRPSWRVTGKNGQIDWEKSVDILSGILQHDQQTIPIDDRIGLLRKAYAERGAGFASLMMGRQFTENLSAAQAGLRNSKGGEDTLSQYASASLFQQGRMALQEFNVAMSDLGTHLMPAATRAVKDFADIVKALDSGSITGLGKLFFDNAIRPDLPGFLGGTGRPFPGTVPAHPRVVPDPSDPEDPLFHKSAFVTDLKRKDGPLSEAVCGGFMRAFREISGGASAGGNTGLISAAYTTFGSATGALGGHASGGGALPGGNVNEIINHAGLNGFNTRGVRNMNIGNIGWGAWARAHGAIGGAGSDTGHLVAVFPSFEAGSAAAEALARSKYLGGARSIDALVAGAHDWTPGNHVAAANIARMMGISPYADANLGDVAAMSRFKGALSVQELGPAGARHAREHMHVGPPPRHPVHLEHTTIVQMDGREIRREITRHIVAANTHQRSAGAKDHYGSYLHTVDPA